MTQGFSVYLDALRFLAAMAVLLSHLAYQRFTRGELQFLRDWDVGSDAVVIFFVLSGLLIARAGDRDGGLGRFAFNRLTRLWSVLVPVLVLTLLLDRSGAMIAPHIYDGWWYTEIPIWQYLLRGLSFSNQWFGDPVRLGTNGPLWSLSYEVSYYALFGAFVFLRGAGRWLTSVLIVMVSGPAIILMLPVWLIGVATWHMIRSDAVKLSTGTALVCVLLLPAAYFVGQDVDRLVVAQQATQFVASLIAPWGAIGFSETFLWDTFLATCLALHLLGIAQLLHSVPEDLEAPIRWLAGASFTIYVLHYPLLQFLHAILPPVAGRDWMLFGMTFAACLGVAQISERRLNDVRKVFSGIKAT